MAIVSRDFDNKEMVLINEKTGKTINAGDTAKDFKGGPVVVTGGRAPHKLSSTGKIWTDDSCEYYPSVINAKWVYI